MEDTFAITVETVVVGDRETDERVGALVAAAREARVNAARHAGVQTAASLRELGFSGRVVVVSGEPHHPYERPPLSKEHLVAGQPTPVALRPRKFFEDKRVSEVLRPNGGTETFGSMAVVRRSGRGPSGRRGRTRASRRSRRTRATR